MSEGELQGDQAALSFVVPVHNEAEGLEAFYRRLIAAAEQLGETFEVVFVDDGSDDGSADILRRLAGEDKRVRVVELSRNFGHQLALTAGYDHATGEAVISLDADGQHPPELIGKLVDKWREGYEVVYTVRQSSPDVPAVRRWAGFVAYKLIRACSGVDLTDQADFRLLDRRAVDALCSAREQGRFLRGLVRWIGFKQAAVPYQAEPRRAGTSSYSLRQLLRMVGAGVFNFSLAPLRIMGVLGGLMLAAAAAYAVVSLIAWPFGYVAGPWWHVLAVALGLFGVQFLFLGLLGEYIGRIFEQVKARPLYVVRRKVGFARPRSRTRRRAELDDTEAERSDAGAFSIYT